MATTSRAPVDERMSEAKHPVTRLGGP
ncbi:MAG: hypothetical protein QOJ09_1965, partial [Actinomycetota bacterium]|nr:hypothetical protein [Actinomycetota bacterium]